MNKREKLRRTASVYAFVTIFGLTTLVFVLATLALGLLWCHPQQNDTVAAETASPVGTWIGADCWERGYSPNDVTVEFYDDGLMTVEKLGMTALYRFEDNTIYTYDLDGDSTESYYQIPGRDFHCSITGDFMMLHGIIPGIHSHRGSTMLIRISDETGLTEEQLKELY